MRTYVDEPTPTSGAGARLTRGPVWPPGGCGGPLKGVGGRARGQALSCSAAWTSPDVSALGRALCTLPFPVCLGHPPPEPGESTKVSVHLRWRLSLHPHLAVRLGQSHPTKLAFGARTHRERMRNCRNQGQLGFSQVPTKPWDKNARGVDKSALRGG